MVVVLRPPKEERYSCLRSKSRSIFCTALKLFSEDLEISDYLRVASFLAGDLMDRRDRGRKPASLKAREDLSLPALPLGAPVPKGEGELTGV